MLLDFIASVSSMNTGSALLWALTIAACVLWQGLLLLAAWNGLSVPSLTGELQRLGALDAENSLPAQPLERLSIVVAACNEAEHLRRTIPRLLALDYPDYEIIAINDRSTDQTGSVLEGFAAHDARLRVVHVEHLPDGWLGKVHALSCGVQRATGAWLLFTDADISFERAALRAAVRFATANDNDHLVVLPMLESRAESRSATGAASSVNITRVRDAIKSLSVHLFNMCFAMMFFVGIKARRVARQGTTAFVGMGAFNLVRRSAWEHAGERLAALDETIHRFTNPVANPVATLARPFAWLKMEVVDDLGVGMLMKRYGRGGEYQGRSAIVLGSDMMSLEWYPSLASSIQGIEKNSFAAFGEYRYGLLAYRVLLLWSATLLPLVLGLVHLVHGSVAVFASIVGLMFFYPGCVGVGAAWLLHRLGGAGRKLPVPAGTLFLLPLGFALLGYALVRSAWMFGKQGGIVWRGTLYPAAALRAGQRVRLWRRGAESTHAGNGIN
jgi:hypothetical protein